MVWAKRFGVPCERCGARAAAGVLFRRDGRGTVSRPPDGATLMRHELPSVGRRAAGRAGAVLVAFLAAVAADGQPAKKVSRADEFLATFGPSPNEQALRTSELAMSEQVRLAFYGIDATRVEVEQGRLSEADGARIIDGHETVIRDYLRDRAQEALILASTGQAADIPRAARSLGALLSLARQDALMGREEDALAAQAQMVRVLTTFSQKFAETCDQQTFPVELAFGLERQNELMGTGISVQHCARRRYSADIVSQGVQYHFETCTALGDGEWELNIGGLVRGTGRGTLDRAGGGIWEASTTFRSVSGAVVTDDWAAPLALVTEVVEAAPAPVAPPDDAGPLAKPNGWAKEAVVAPQEPPAKLTIKKLRMETINMIGGGRGYMGTGPWAEAEIRRGLEQPCKVKER